MQILEVLESYREDMSGKLGRVSTSGAGGCAGAGKEGTGGAQEWVEERERPEEGGVGLR